MKYLAILLCLALVACGGGAPPKDVATVRAYTDWQGSPTPNADSLEWTYWSSGRGAKYGVEGYNILVNEMLVADDDPDRIVRVICHGLLNTQAERAGRYPDTIAGDWYLWSSENVPPFAAPVAAEAAWLATLPTMRVVVDGRDPWLVEPTREAVERMNEAAGRVVFKWLP